jgi:putative glutathione S-transferase
LWRWLREMYRGEGIAETVDLAQIKRHYYHSQHWVNPSGVVPVGPTLDFAAPHGRECLRSEPAGEPG